MAEGTPPMALDVQDVLEQYNVHYDSGLTNAQVEASRNQHGRNEIPDAPKKSIWKLVLEQFDDLLVKILLAAAVISLLLAITEEDEAERQTAFVEPLVIMVILILNAIVGVWQERGAEMALDALKQYDPNMAKVMRNGEVTMVTAEEVVPGDILMVRVGDKIAADARLVQIESMTVRAEQATLTGEAASVLKDTDAVAADADINSRSNMVFKGTAIEYGTCKAIVVSTGLNTEFGKIHASLADDEDEDNKTPLKRKLDEFGELLSKVITVICVLVWLMNINHFSEHGDWIRGAVYYFKIAVALAVAAIPEGLPAVVTTCLSLGTAQMAKKNAIVRSLPAVETLGCTTVICSDKTGTLTTNKMCVVKVLVVGSGTNTIEYDVDGDSFAPEGALRNGGQEVEGESVRHLRDVANVCSLCNDSSIVYNEKSQAYEKVGEATEAAMKVLVEKVYGGSNASNLNVRASFHNKQVMAKYNRKATLEFSRDRKSMSVYCVEEPTSGVQTPRRTTRQSSKTTGSAHMFVKGAPEGVLDRCTKVRNEDGSETPLSPAVRKVLDSKLAEYGTGSTTLRCLALAVIDNPAHKGDFQVKSSADFIGYEQDMTFIGIVGMIDPPRLEVKDSIIECRKAFIRVVVITGDNKGTAEAICRRIGVFNETESTAGKSFTGKEFSQMSKEKKLECVKTARLFSRTEPMHKRELVELLQSQGEVVAMTGDGVNDAPALKKADIGIAMGSGTEVAKGASEMILADDNFSTIVAAVEEGRAIYANTKQFIRYLISSNIGEVVCIFFAASLGIPEVMVPVQLLWVNLVTDGLPATALSFNPPDPDIMKQPPRSASEQIVNGWMFFRYMFIGIYVGVATVMAYIWWFTSYSKGPLMTFEQLTEWEDCENRTFGNDFDCEVFEHRGPSTMSLSVLVAIEMLNAFNSLSEDQSLLMFPPYKNLYLVAACALSCSLHFMILFVPVFQTIFRITWLGQEEWEYVMFLSLPVLLTDEFLKLLSRWTTKRVDTSKKEE